jgi:hypothetical protein
MTTNFDTIADVTENVTQAIKVHEDDLTAAAQHRNPDLTPEANQRETEVRKEKARKESLEWIERQSSSARLAATRAEQSLNKIRPHVDENSAASLVRAEQRWNYQVRPLLEAGKPLREVLKTATVDDLLAIERFAGGWLTVQRMTTDSPLEIEPDALEGAILNRLVTALPEDQREAFEDAVRARHAGKVFDEVHELAVEAITGKSHNPLSNWALAKTRVSKLR